MAAARQTTALFGLHPGSRMVVASPGIDNAQLTAVANKLIMFTLGLPVLATSYSRWPR